MTKARPLMPSLNGGEVDGETIARSDIDSYSNKAAVYENALPVLKGGMIRAPGTREIGRCLSLGPNADVPTIVRQWRFTRAQSFTMEITHKQLRIVFGGGYIQTAAGDGAFGASWTDTSSGGASADSSEPGWGATPFDPSAVGAQGPLNSTYPGDVPPEWLPGGGHEDNPGQGEPV